MALRRCTKQNPVAVWLRNTRHETGYCSMDAIFENGKPTSMVESTSWGLASKLAAPEDFRWKLSRIAYRFLSFAELRAVGLRDDDIMKYQ